MSDDLPATLHDRTTLVAESMSEQRLRAYAQVCSLRWVDAIAELFSRLESDWSQLVEAFGIARDATLDAISPPLGDMHNHGRSVYRLEFSDGGALMYKPRSVGTEAAFGQLLECLRQNGCTPDLSYCQALPRVGYGWTRYVEEVACETADEANVFYQRQGGFLAVIWLLCADDAISDNVIVHRDHPIWVDTECLCHPEIDCATGTSAGVPEWIADSVLTTAMIFLGKEKGAPPRRNTGLNVSCFRDRSLAFSSTDTLKPVYVDAVAHGFEETYSWLLRCKKAWFSEHRWKAWWWDLRVRVLLRPTGLYADLSGLLAMTPEAMQADVRREVADVLRTGQGSRNGVSAWPEDIVQGEMRALERGDVPYWSTSTTSRDLWEGDGWVVRSASRTTGFECMEHRRMRMSERDLQQQLWLIRAFLGNTASDSLP